MIARFHLGPSHAARTKIETEQIGRCADTRMVARLENSTDDQIHKVSFAMVDSLSVRLNDLQTAVGPAVSADCFRDRCSKVAERRRVRVRRPGWLGS
jgi:hypothetical protein